MNGLSYLEACLKECNEETTLSFGSYNSLFVSYKKDSYGIIITDNTQNRIFVDSEKVFSEYDGKYNVLEIKL